MNNNKPQLATTWYPDTLIGIAVIFIYFFSNIVFFVVMGSFIHSDDMLMLSCTLFSLAIVITLFNLQKKKLYPEMLFKGVFSFSDYRFNLYLMIGLMLFVTLLNKIFSISDELFIDQLFYNKSQYQVMILCIEIVLLSPILEEFLFRHFILAIFPYNLGGKWAAYAIVFSSLIFTLLHTQYIHFITMLNIFVVGVILSLARIISKGLLLPILLHMSYNFITLCLYFLL
ncbi:CPBP family intramembrane glutamic endopeptidase [Orbus mooreae]|uniref:CPBP family intramembrane glutamic endopeptidase n=1 Tax=Orbus mooreae TaxID=3074107 RepID=UPI00370D6FCD